MLLIFPLIPEVSDKVQPQRKKTKHRSPLLCSSLSSFCYTYQEVFCRKYINTNEHFPCLGLWIWIHMHTYSPRVGKPFSPMWFVYSTVFSAFFFFSPLWVGQFEQFRPLGPFFLLLLEPVFLFYFHNCTIFFFQQKKSLFSQKSCPTWTRNNQNYKDWFSHFGNDCCWLFTVYLTRIY